MPIGERLRSVRERLGLSQREAARRARLRYQYLSNLENDRVENPSLDTLVRLAQGYGIGVDALIGHGVPFDPEHTPQGLRELREDPEWAAQLTGAWVETLMGIRHEGSGLQTKQEFLEAFLALRRIFG